MNSAPVPGALRSSYPDRYHDVAGEQASQEPTATQDNIRGQQDQKRVPWTAGEGRANAFCRRVEGSICTQRGVAHVVCGSGDFLGLGFYFRNYPLDKAAL